MSNLNAIKFKRIQDLVDNWQMPTPCVIYDSKLLSCSATDTQRKINPSVDKIRYALKACYIPEVARSLYGLGFGLEVMTRNEALHGCACGWAFDAMDYNSVGRTIGDFEWAIKRNIHCTLSSIQEVDHFISASQLSVQDELVVGIRLKTNLTAESYVRFGIEVDKAREAIELLDGNRIIVDELKVHSIRDDLTELPMDEVLNILSLFGLVSTGPQYLNLGGGDVEKHITLFQACFTHLVELKAVPALRCEPGALLVNSSAVGIGTVLEVYDQLVVIDIPSNWLPPLKRANYKFENMSREFSGEERQVCDNLLAFPSYVNRKFDLGAVQVGDKVVVTNIGAYTHTFASSLGLAPFNGYWVDTENNVTRLTWPIDNTGETLLEGLSAKRMVI